MVRGENDKGGGVRLAPKCKFRAEGLVYYLGSNDRDGQSSLSKKGKQGRI